MTKILQTNRFSKVFKKLSSKEQVRVKKEIKLIASDPLIGPKKKGVLKRLRVHKYSHNKQLKLLGYVYEKKVITLIDYGSHENFYRDILL